MIPLKIWSRFVMASIIGVLLITSSLPVLADQLTAYAYRDFSGQGMSAGSWAARVNFSAPVFLVNLKQAIKVLADGREIDCDISMDGDQNQGKSSRTFIITPKRINPLPSTISLTIHKGLTDLLGNKTLVKPFIYEFQSVEQISVNGLETYFRSTSDRGIKMLLSGGSVTDKDLRNAIKIDPGVPDLKIRRNDEGAYEISGNFVKDQNYTIQILQIPTKEGTAVFAQNEFQFLGPGLSREIAFQSENSIVELRSRQFVPVRLSGVPQMRCELSKIPPILIAQLASDGFVFPVVRLEIDFKAPAFHDDLLSVVTTPVRIGGSSVTLCQKIVRHNDGKLLVDGFVTLACIGPALKAKRIPLAIRRMLEAELENAE